MYASLFTQAFDEIKTQIEFKPEYMANNSYLQPICSMDLMDEVRGCRFVSGDRCKMIDSMDRRVIIIATEFGNVVFFERYAPRIKARTVKDRVEGRQTLAQRLQDLVVVCNYPVELEGVIPTGVVSNESFELFSGLGDAPNIGHTTIKLVEAALALDTAV